MSTIKKMSNLSERSSLITGGSGHLGKIFAHTLAELGSDLILIDRPGTELESLAAKVQDQWNVKVEIYFCDLEVAEQLTDLISELNVSKKKINILVNNAAFVGSADLEGWSVDFSKQSITTWRRAIEVNLTAVFELTQGLYPLLKSSQGASIINIGSTYAMYGPDWTLYEGTNMGNPAAYAASKSGLIGLTRWLATTIAPDVRVNAISPGGIYRNQPENFVKKYSDRTPLKRMATEDDFRGVIAFLASDMSRYVTGQVIEVDGGWGVW